MGYAYLLVLFAICFTLIEGERLNEQIYSSIEGGAACFRRLNGTHQTGCSNSKKGTVGAVLMIKELTDAQWLAQNATSGPYTAVVSSSLFHDTVELLINHPENVAGILVYENASSSASAFTHDSKCPNEYSSAPGSQCSSKSGGIVWNEKGSGLLQADIPFPIFFLPQNRIEEIEKIEKCYERFNLDRNDHQGRPLCSIQLYSFMFAAVNSEVCLRRSANSYLLNPTKVCDPLGDRNVYYSLFPRVKNESESKNESVILVTARIDSASLFDRVSPGAASSVVGLVTVIAAAATLSKLIPETDAHLYDKNVLFTLFNGESFDYIGSQRVAYDMRRGVWPQVAPLAAKDVRLHVELGQLGGALSAHKYDTAWPLFAFAHNDTNVTEVSKFVDEMSKNVNPYNMEISPEITVNLPPSSLHSFRRILMNSSDTEYMPELVIVDHKETFTNLFYQSALDDYEKIGFNYHNISIGPNGTFLTTDQLLANGTMKENEPQVKIARLATALALTLYQQVVGKSYVGDIAASAHLVDEMLYCLLRSQACSLLRAADFVNNDKDRVPEKPAPLYVGVSVWYTLPSVFTAHLLALLTGDTIPYNKTGCYSQSDPSYSYYWFNGWNNNGSCIQTTMNYSRAFSPAFIIPDYDIKSGEYSTWAESVWEGLWARMFVSAGGGGARWALGCGLAATLLAASLTYWMKRHNQLLFTHMPAASAVRDDAASGILRTVNC